MGADRGNGLRGGFNNDGGAPEGSPAFEEDEIREPWGVVLRSGESYDSVFGV